MEYNINKCPQIFAQRQEEEAGCNLLMLFGTHAHWRRQHWWWSQCKFCHPLLSNSTLFQSLYHNLMLTWILRLAITCICSLWYSSNCCDGLISACISSLCHPTNTCSGINNAIHFHHKLFSIGLTNHIQSLSNYITIIACRYLSQIAFSHFCLVNRIQFSHSYHNDSSLTLITENIVRQKAL